MTILQRVFLTVALLTLAAGIGSSLYAQDAGPQVTAAIPCDYSPESMTTAFDRCQPVATNLSPIEEPVAPASLPLHGFVEYGTNSCFIHPAVQVNTRKSSTAPTTEIAQVNVENKSVGLNCEYSVYFYHSEDIATIAWSAGVCETLSSSTARCSGSLNGGQKANLVMNVAVDATHTYPSDVQLTAPGLTWIYTWKFFGYGNFQPFVSR